MVCAAHVGGRGNPVRFDIGAEEDGQPRRSLRLSYDFVTDLYGTKEFQFAISAFLARLKLILLGPEPNYYMTLRGIPLAIEIEWPFQLSTDGGSYHFVHVHTKTLNAPPRVANFSVHLTHTISTMAFPSLEFVIVESCVVNSIRKAIGDGAVFYSDGQHPSDLQIAVISSKIYESKPKRFHFANATDQEITDFLIRKVYWLGFKQGRKKTAVLIADPFDAEYLGASVQHLERVADLIAANGLIELDSTGKFANSTDTLLKSSSKYESIVAPLVADRIMPEPDTTTPSVKNSATDGSPSAFISYSSQDRDFSTRLATDLKSKSLGVWFDQWEIRVGDSLLGRIGSGIRSNDFLIVLLSPDSVKSEWVKKELAEAMSREIAEKRVVVLPALVKDCTVPPFLTDKKYANFRADYQRGLSELIEAIQHHPRPAR